MIKSIIFDLDETLYHENDFVYSGFKHIAQVYFDNSKGIFDKLCFIYNEEKQNKTTMGGYKVFDKLLLEMGTYSFERVMELSYSYRTHTPFITPYDWVRPLLRELRDNHIKVGILTNGKTMPQYNKIMALGIMGLITKYLICDILDFKYWKPHPLPYKIMLSWLHVKPQEALFVDDNIENVESALSLGMNGLLCKEQSVMPSEIRRIINESK